ncbi:putative transporter B0252.3 [Tubulanus polymorphus]|uniref:putative transporter B0252.3 n=1 Tax=Tubulanus polymorphus TaxID=672921 RepID=UPI003DA38155
MALGTVLLMPLADKYGRRPTVIYGTLVLVVTWVISAFSVNYIMFAAFRVVHGIITVVDSRIDSVVSS